MRTIFRILLHMEAHRLPSMLEAIAGAQIPVRIIAGLQDDDVILEHARKIRSVLSASTLYEIANGDHMFWACGSSQQQAAYRDIVVDFLKGNPDATGNEEFVHTT